MTTHDDDLRVAIQAALDNGTPVKRVVEIIWYVMYDAGMTPGQIEQHARNTIEAGTPVPLSNAALRNIKDTAAVRKRIAREQENGTRKT